MSSDRSESLPARVFRPWAARSRTHMVTPDVQSTDRPAVAGIKAVEVANGQPTRRLGDGRPVQFRVLPDAGRASDRQARRGCRALSADHSRELRPGPRCRRHPYRTRFDRGSRRACQRHIPGRRVQSCEGFRWSVLLRGQAESLTAEHGTEVVERTQATCVVPWAPGECNHWMRIVPHGISGRRITPGQDLQWRLARPPTCNLMIPDG
jgi:hypothetical protein